jgi:tRNA (guanine-N7-)-methyltransferase
MGADGFGPAVEERIRLIESGIRRSELYGRRVGRPLSFQQQELVRTLLPSVSVPEGTIDFASLFPEAQTFAFEVGFGGGEHIASTAVRYRNWGFVGCEPYANGVAKLLTQIEAHGLTNVRIFQGDARVLLERVPAQSLSAFYVLFPDPWPKVRHHRRRFIQPPTLAQIARVLKKGGELRIATDHEGYAGWTMSHLMNDNRFGWTAECAADWRVRPDDWSPTRYEQKALASGRSCVYLKFFRS